MSRNPNIAAKLTSKQEKFAQCVADGMTQADAYRAAYNAKNMKPETVQKRASELMSGGVVSGRVKELQKTLAETALWDRVQAAEVLKGIVYCDDEETRTADRISAVKELNSVFGLNKLNVDHSSSDGSMTPPKEIKLIPLTS